VSIVDTIALCVLRVVTLELSRTLHLQLEEAEVEVEQKQGVKFRQGQGQGQGQGGRLEKEKEKEKEQKQDVSCVLSPCYAILLTTAPLLLNIHPYIAERVVAAVTSLCSRMATRSDISSRRSISKNNSKDNGRENGRENSDCKKKVEDRNTNTDKDESKNVNRSEYANKDTQRDKDKDKLLTDRDDEDKDKVKQKDEDKDIEAMSEALAVILQFINILIRPHTRLSNIRLLYSLMHAGEEIIPALQEGGIEHTVDPLIALLPMCVAGVPNRRPKELSLLVQSYLTLLEEKSREGEGVTVQDATAGLSVLRGIINEETSSGRFVSHVCVGVSVGEGDEGGKEVKAVKEGNGEMKGGKGDNEGKGGIDAEKEENGEECKGEGEEEEEDMDSSMYRYEESPCPASFFLPAAWCYALHSSPDLCNLLPVHSITLLDPYTEGIIHDHNPSSYPSFSHSSTQPRDGDGSHLPITTAVIDDFV
jgi:hypothetical protein